MKNNSRVSLDSLAVRGKRLVSCTLCALAVGMVLTNPDDAQAFDKTRSVDWPNGWASPKSGKSYEKIEITANFGAYSTGCTNSDRSTFTRIILTNMKRIWV